MLIPLRDLEMYFDDELVEQSTLLRAEGCIRSLREVDKNLWVAYIDKDGIFETEAVIAQQKIKAFSCECPEFQKKHICSHSLCMLLALRDQKMTQAAQKSTANHPAKKSFDTQLKDMLRAVSHDELVDFLAEYSKKDTKLAMLLRSRFMSVQEGENPAAMYKSLIESVSSPLYRPSESSGNQTSLHLKSLFMQLLKKAGQRLRQGDFAGTWDILLPVYAELVKLHTKKLFPKSFAAYVHQLTALLTELYQQTSSAAQKMDIWEQLIPLKVAFWEEFHCLEPLFAHVILPLSRFAHKEESLIGHLESLLQQYGNHYELKNQLSVFNMMIAYQTGNNRLIENVLQEHADSVSALYFSANKAYESSQFGLAAELLRLALSKRNAPEWKQRIEELLYLTALKNNDLPDICIYGQKRLLDTNDPQYYFVLREKGCGEAYLQTAVKELESAPPARARNHCLCAIYALQDDTGKLIDIIQKVQSLELLMQYDQQLHLSDEAILQMYQAFIRQYLRQHLGRQASLRIIQVITHLKGSARLSLAQELLRMLILEFPERHTLMEELEHLA